MSSTTLDVEKTPPYVEGLTFDDFVEWLAVEHPALRKMLHKKRTQPDNIVPYILEMQKTSWEFETTTDGGRGDNYNLAQKAISNRSTGMSLLLKLFQTNWAPEEPIILDALAGDGVIARFAAKNSMEKLRIISADLSDFMIQICMQRKLPCIRQSATRSLLSDGVLDGVLIAYGSHHIPKDKRKLAALEAFRTLRKGGRFVLHDFEAGGSTANWFERVVHPYSRTGHSHRHFTREELFSLLANAGFRDVRVFDMDDSFTLSGATPEEAKENALYHLYHMYDLVKISNCSSEALQRVEVCVRDTFGEIKIMRDGEEYTATIERTALVGVGTKLDRLEPRYLDEVMENDEKCVA